LLSLDRWTLGGLVGIVLGALVLAGTVLLVGPGSNHTARAFVDPPVWLVVNLSDSASGNYASGATVTVTATVSDASTTTTGTDVSGTTTTATIDSAAHPTVTFSYDTGVLSFVSNGGGYTCSLSAGLPTCSESGTSSLSPGSANAIPIALAVIGGPANTANVTASVTGQRDVETNMAPASSTVATDSAAVTNPGSYTNEAPSGCFPRKIGSDAVISNAPGPVASLSSPETFTFTNGSAQITVVVPPGALPNGARLSLYGADPACWNAVLSSTTSSSQTFAGGYAVGWAFSGSTSFSASSSVTLDVSDSSVSSGDGLYKSNGTGLDSTTTGSVASGGWTVSFSDDPGFVLAAAAPATSTTTTSSSSTTSTSATTSATSSSSATTTSGASRAGTSTSVAIPALPSSGTLQGRPPAPVIPIVVAVFLIVAGTVAVGLRRRA